MGWASRLNPKARQPARPVVAVAEPPAVYGHRCTVCGYDDNAAGFTTNPCDYYICWCCGTEFGYDDCTRTHEQLRDEWMAGGCVWWARFAEPPAGWDAARQLGEAQPGDGRRPVAIDEPRKSEE